jgi:hypothetical protein
MTTIVEQLKQASEFEKKAYVEYVKTFASSGIATLVKGGVPMEKAASMVKEACVSDSKAGKLMATSQVFEKAAEYIIELEEKLAKLEKFASEMQEEKAIEESTPLNKLASIGFSKEELTYINSLPENLVEKVASMGSKPWEMGSGVGMAREKTDPLLEFILS